MNSTRRPMRLRTVLDVHRARFEFSAVEPEPGLW